MKNKKGEVGKFCELYGESIRNRVLEYILENQSLDFAIGDLAEEIKISRPKAYEEAKALEKKKYIIKTRIVAGTQLYGLNKENQDVKQLMKTFDECLDLVVEEYAPKPLATPLATGRVGMSMSAKNV